GNVASLSGSSGQSWVKHTPSFEVERQPDTCTCEPSGGSPRLLRLRCFSGSRGYSNDDELAPQCAQRYPRGTAVRSWMRLAPRSAWLVHDVSAASNSLGRWRQRFRLSHSRHMKPTV